MDQDKEEKAPLPPLLSHLGVNRNEPLGALKLTFPSWLPGDRQTACFFYPLPPPHRQRHPQGCIFVNWSSTSTSVYVFGWSVCMWCAKIPLTCSRGKLQNFRGPPTLSQSVSQ